MVTLNNINRSFIILAINGHKLAKKYNYQDIMEVIEHPYSDLEKKRRELTVQKKWSYEFHVVVRQPQDE